MPDERAITPFENRSDLVARIAPGSQGVPPIRASFEEMLWNLCGGIKTRFPLGRTESELPEQNFYFGSVGRGSDTNHLFRLSWRRPLERDLNYHNGRATPTQGLFVDIFEMDQDGIPRRAVTADPAVAEHGEFQLTDIVDGDGDPFFEEGHLTPTIFYNTKQLRRNERLGRRIALPGGTGSSFADRLFSQPPPLDDADVNRAIEKRFFEGGIQSYSEEIDPKLGVIISDDGRDSPINKIMESLGMKTRTLPFFGCVNDQRFLYEEYIKNHPQYVASWPPASGDYRYFDLLEETKDTSGSYPLIVVADTESLGDGISVPRAQAIAAVITGGMLSKYQRTDHQVYAAIRTEEYQLKERPEWGLDRVVEWKRGDLSARFRTEGMEEFLKHLLLGFSYTRRAREIFRSV